LWERKWIFSTQKALDRRLKILSGFVREGVQPESLAVGVRVIFCLFPALMILIGFLPFSRYRLTEEEFERVKEKIAQRGK
jgi:Na+/melibiose symporter-like transporter